MWYSKKVLFYFRLIFPIFFYGVDSIFVCIFFVFFFMVCFFFYYGRIKGEDIFKETVRRTCSGSEHFFIWPEQVTYH